MVNGLECYTLKDTKIKRGLLTSSTFFEVSANTYAHIYE